MMKTSIRRRLKKAVTKRLQYKGGIYALIRILVMKRRFRLVFLGVTVGMVALLLFMAPIWRFTPKGFHPMIRSSGLDWVQAWSLKRTAMDWEASGQTKKAAIAWMAAFANHRGDVTLARGILKNAIQQSEIPRDPKTQRILQAIALWLISLSDADPIDLHLVAELFLHCQWPDMLVTILTPWKDQLDEHGRELFLNALVLANEEESFATLRQAWEGHIAATGRLAVLDSYHAAMTRSGQVRSVAFEALKVARQQGPFQGLARTLSLRIAFSEDDVDQFERILQEQGVGDSMEVSMNYWKLLESSGRVEQAVRLARNFQNPVHTVEEALAYVKFLESAGESTHARHWLEKQIASFKERDEIWLAYSQLTIASRDWAEVENVALQIRQLRPSLSGFSYYLEGLARVRTGRHQSARHLFEKARAYGIAPPRLLLKVCADLVRYRLADLAEDWLRENELLFESDPDYWEMRFHSAEALGQPHGLLEASEHLMRLSSHDPQYRNYYSAALLLDPGRCHEALWHTLPLIQSYPHSIAANLNHAMALMANARHPEAHEILQSLETRSLTSEQRAALNFAWVHWFIHGGRNGEALIRAERIDKEYLVTPQRAWLVKVESLEMKDTLLGRTSVEP